MSAPMLVALRAPARPDASPGVTPVPVPSTPPAAAAAAVPAATQAGTAPAMAPQPRAAEAARDVLSSQDVAQLPRLPAPTRLEGVRIQSHAIPLQITVDASGRVTALRFGRTEAAPPLLEALGRSMQGLRFLPARRPDGSPAAVEWQVRLCFDDQGDLHAPTAECWLPWSELTQGAQVPASR